MRFRLPLLATAALAVFSQAALASVSFTSGPSISANGGNGAAVTDFDGDGNPDLLAGTTMVSGGATRVVPGNGDGTLGSHVILNNLGTQGLGVVDAGGDALPDVASADYYNTNVRLYRNTSTPGSISFAETVLPYSGGYGYSVDMGDVNGDTRPDIIVGTTAEVKLALQNGDGTFGAFADISSAPGFWATLADVTGSPALDLVQVTALAGTSPELRVAAGNGNGTFAAPQVLAFSGSGGYGSIKDLDDDGDLDVLVARLGSGVNSVVVLRNDAGTFAVGPSKSVGNRPWTTDFADVDADGIDDVVVASLNTSPAWIKGTGDATMFGAASGFGVGSGSDIATGDVDNDLRPDAFLVSNGTTSRVLRNTSTVSGSVTVANPFGSADVGTNVDRTVTITNDGSSPLRPGSIGFAGDHPGDFSVVTSACSAVTLLVGQSCTATVRFAPAAAGARTATVSSPTGLPVAGTVFTGALTGTGLLGVLTGPSTADTGTLQLGESGSVTVTLANGGDASLTPSAAQLSGGSDWTVSADGCSGIPLAPAQTCTVTVRVTPTAAGTSTATLTVPGSAVSVALTALAQAPAATPDPESEPDPVAEKPVLVVGPSVPRTGQMLVARARFKRDAGTRLTVVWLRCSSTGHGCRAVGRGAKYRVTAADLGRRLRVRVVAIGTTRTTHVSPLTAVVRAPGLARPLRIMGPAKPRVGQWLRVHPRSAGAPRPRMSITWLRCSSSGRVCRPIRSGARYRLTTADRGKRLRVRVIANGTGRSVHTSPMTAVVAGRDRR